MVASSCYCSCIQLQGQRIKIRQVDLDGNMCSTWGVRRGGGGGGGEREGGRGRGRGGGGREAELNSLLFILPSRVGTE